MIDNSGIKEKAYMIFRDIERDNRVSVAICYDLQQKEWRFMDLDLHSFNMWEPTYDTELWMQTKTLHIFVQNVGQGDGEKLENFPLQFLSIIEWKP